MCVHVWFDSYDHLTPFTTLFALSYRDGHPPLPAPVSQTIKQKHTHTHAHTHAQLGTLADMAGALACYYLKADGRGGLQRPPALLHAVKSAGSCLLGSKFVPRIACVANRKCILCF